MFKCSSASELSVGDVCIAHDGGYFAFDVDTGMATLQQYYRQYYGSCSER